MNYLALVFKLVILGVSMYLIGMDINKRELESKYSWIWLISILAASVLIDIIGIVLVIVSYYIWISQVHQSN